jgi:hypothetical protein
VIRCILHFINTALRLHRVGRKQITFAYESRETWLQTLSYVRNNTNRVITKTRR